MISPTYDYLYAPASEISWECHLASTPSTQQPVYDVGIVEAMKATPTGNGVPEGVDSISARPIATISRQHCQYQ
jgi:hypothetical protein